MTSIITNGLSSAMRAISNGARYPVIVLLLLAALLTLGELAGLAAEYFSDHRHLKAELPRLVDQLHAAENPSACIRESGLLRTQKKLLLELLKHPDLPENSLTALGEALLEEQEDRYAATVRRSDLVARIAPMLGLLGTLIPLGPGIISLGQGDTYTLSLSLLTAFDTTVLGLISAAVALVISSVRRKWYKRYMDQLRALAECVLEEMTK